MKRRQKPPNRLEHEHSREAISDRLSKGPRQSYIRDLVYGGIDGSITTFAIVSGVEGASLSAKTLLILGVANLVADGFSMSAANYLGTRSELEEYRYLDALERRHIHHAPEGEREETRQVLARRGLHGETLERAVGMVTADQENWVRMMLSDEHGVPGALRSPWKAAGMTYLAFSICGFIPLLPFVFGFPAAFTVSSVLTGMTFFLVGSLRSFWSIKPWWKTGLHSFLVGSLAAGLAYAVGAILGSGSS